MTSPDGIAWTIRTSAADNDWSAVTYGNGLFVAVASTGTGNRVMTSPDGTTWTIRTSAADNSWSAVTYGNGLFVAVASSGTGDRVMTSPDGIAWTIRTSAADNRWSSVTYGTALNQTDLEQPMGVFVAVAWMGSDRVMTSPDGITWTTRTQAADSMWTSVTYGLGLFVAVSRDSSAEVMTSPDGTTWTIGPSSPEQKAWNGVTFGFDPIDGTAYAVAVADSGTAGNRVMTLSSSLPSPQYTNAGRTSKVLGCFAVSTGICMTAWLIATVTSI
jgi:predicted RecA/RadA family phage recombinase